MITIAIAEGMDVSSVPQIDRFTDGVNVYIVQTQADYALLPQAIQDQISLAALTGAMD